MCVFTQSRSKFLGRCENLLNAFSFITKRKHKTKECVFSNCEGQGKWCVNVTAHMAHLKEFVLYYRKFQAYKNRIIH